MLSFLLKRYLQATVARILNWAGRKDRLAYLDSWEDLGLLHRPLVELLNNSPKYHRKKEVLGTIWREPTLYTTGSFPVGKVLPLKEAPLE